MRFSAQECPDGKIGQQSADRLPWFHIVTIIAKFSPPLTDDGKPIDAVLMDF
jgi:hypothetical protein